MSEPTESVEPAQPLLAEPAQPPPAQPWQAYGTYTPPVVEPVVPADPVRGLLAGAGVALVGAVLWALVVYATSYEIGFLAVLIGYGVGYAVHRAGRVASTGVAAAAALVAAAGILLGFVLTGVAVVAKVAGVGLMDAVNLVSDRLGWGNLISDSITGVDWLFLAIGAFAAFRLVTGQRVTTRRR